MKIEVLLSCMHEKDAGIIRRSNIQSDVVVINQCDENRTEAFTFKNAKGEECSAKMIYTTERGLSRSRNMALRNASGDILIICDDDEIFEDDYVERITTIYEEHPDVDSFMFAVHLPGKTFGNKPYKIGRLKSLSVKSVQITLRRTAIKDLGVVFDITMGSGTGNGGGEENKFVYELCSKGLNIHYYPYWMATVAQTQSQWFVGYDEKFWFDIGWRHKKIIGLPLSVLYCFYAVVKKYDHYEGRISAFTVLKQMLKGVFCVR